jgi:hypothetical protein
MGFAKGPVMVKFFLEQGIYRVIQAKWKAGRTLDVQSLVAVKAAGTFDE